MHLEKKKKIERLKNMMLKGSWIPLSRYVLRNPNIYCHQEMRKVFNDGYQHGRIKKNEKEDIVNIANRKVLGCIQNTSEKVSESLIMNREKDQEQDNYNDKKRVENDVEWDKAYTEFPESQDLFVSLTNPAEVAERRSNAADQISIALESIADPPETIAVVPRSLILDIPLRSIEPGFSARRLSEVADVDLQGDSIFDGLDDFALFLENDLQ